MKIIIKPRLHITLISMHADDYRLNGGVGFTLSNPTGLITALPAEQFSLQDERVYPLSNSEIAQLESSIVKAQEYYKFEKTVRIILTGDLVTHYGMGSGTSIRLACLEALFAMNGRPTDKQELIAFSKRGGASGIGINTYFEGKFVFDLGVKNLNNQFLPSSKTDAPKFPLLLDAIEMPNWNIGVCIPKHIKAKTQDEETAFFKKTCPISQNESYKALYQSLFGLYAAIKEHDFSTFANAIKTIQECEWKKKERAEYGQPLLDLENKLYSHGALSVGMSSLGPLLFFFAEDYKYSEIFKQMGGVDCDIIISPTSNSGRTIMES